MSGSFIIKQTQKLLIYLQKSKNIFIFIIMKESTENNLLSIELEIKEQQTNQPTTQTTKTQYINTHINIQTHLNYYILNFMSCFWSMYIKSYYQQCQFIFVIPTYIYITINA
ncbi:hypothetical protein ABPG72_002731 [Tetrahymena utriculariae]